MANPRFPRSAPGSCGADRGIRPVVYCYLDHTRPLVLGKIRTSRARGPDLLRPSEASYRIQTSRSDRLSLASFCGDYASRFWVITGVKPFLSESPSAPGQIESKWSSEPNPADLNMSAAYRLCDSGVWQTTSPGL